MKEKMRPRSPTQREHFEFLSILLNLFLDLQLIVVVVMMVPSPASRREAETILYDSPGCLCLYFYLAFLIIFLMKEFFLKDEASGTGRKKLESRENRLRLCAFNPFPQTPGREYPSLWFLCDCRKGSQLFSLQLFVFIFLSFALFADCKNPRRRQTVLLGWKK